jgi:L-ascorbate metabolism protein UlaG (beta-lactamase superfamily)
MKKKIIFSVFAVFCVLVYSQNPHPKGTITFIGNEGFMIESQGKKVLIDALYNSTMNGIFNTDATMRVNIINGIPPFDSSQLLLISHTHDDHFSQQMTLDYLLKNPQSSLIAPSSVTDSIIKHVLDNRVISESPIKYQKFDTSVNGISIGTFFLLHKLRLNIYNVGFFISIKGFKVFHAGDNVLDDTTEYIRYNIAQYRPDVALLNYTAFWQAEAQRAFVKKYINPRFIIIMHIPKDQAVIVKKQVDQVQSSLSDTSFPPIVVFENSLERCIITDSIEQIRTNIKTKTTVNIQVFPNPCKDWCYLNTEICGEVGIFNSTGNIIKRLKINQPSTKLPVEDILPGLYFLTCKNGSATFLKE